MLHCSAIAILRLLSHIDDNVADRGIAEFEFGEAETSPPSEIPTVDEMERRLVELEEKMRSKSHQPARQSSGTAKGPVASVAQVGILPVGWSRPDAATWTPKPVGVWS